MVYRRRRSYRSSRSRPEYTWIRNQVSNATTMASTDLAKVDLLAPLHYPSTVLGRIPGPGADTQAVVGTKGCTIVRILGDLILRPYATTPPLHIGAGCFTGIYVGRFQHAEATYQRTAALSEPYDEDDPQSSANVTDWMWWRHTSAWRDPCIVSTTSGGGAWNTINIDVKARRVLREIGDTVIFSVRPAAAGGAIQADWQLSTSVLLRRRT